MDKIIYHGSDHVITKPVYKMGNRHNDYGLGFYCTENLDMAKEWGVSESRNGFASRYKINMDSLSVLNLESAEYSMLEWLTILLENRTFDTSTPLAMEAKDYLFSNFHLPYEHYDIITGYRADDSYFSFASDFINGIISYRILCNAMKLGKLGVQFVLKSRKSFNQLTFLSFEEANAYQWFPRKNTRMKGARHEYFDREKGRRIKGDLYITTILDEEMKRDDPRLR